MNVIRSLVDRAAGLRTWMASSGLRIPGKGRPLLRALVAALCLPPAAVYLWFLILPWPVTLRWRDPPRTSFMEFRIREAKRSGETLVLNQEWVPLEEISPQLRRAVMAAEDDRFLLHHGIDWRALAEEVRYEGDTTFAWWKPDDLGNLGSSLAFVWRNRSEIKGRSTITQQLVKNLYFTPDRSMFRKMGEAVVAKRLEVVLSKDRILELYLNVAEWGPGIFGAQAAAQTYFGRDAADLSLSQAAALAATLPHPLTSNPAFRPAQMEWRRNLLLARLRGPTPPPPPDILITLPPDTVLVGKDTTLGTNH